MYENHTSRLEISFCFIFVIVVFVHIIMIIKVMDAMVVEGYTSIKKNKYDSRFQKKIINDFFVQSDDTIEFFSFWH